MQFSHFKEKLQAHFKEMLKGGKSLFLTDVPKDEIFEHYLNSFPEGTNKIYNERREYDCNSCKQFIRPYGNLVTITDNKMISIWDIPGLEHPFNEVAKAMSSLMKSKPIKDIFISKFPQLGIDSNKQMLEGGKIITWEHFSCKLPNSYIDSSSDSIEARKGQYRDSKNVFKRSMDELTIEAGEIILELIEQKSLYRGEEHKSNIQTFIKYKKQYNKLQESDQDIWCWANSINNPISRIRNSALGTLLIDLSNNMEIDQAVTKFEKVMAPTNYKRPKAIITKRMIEDAEKKIEELGFTNSLGRRFAQLEDITVNNIIFVNRDAKKKLKNSVFDELKEDLPEISKKYDKVDKVSIDDFIKDILPKSNSIELMVENKHIGNLMSLIAPQDQEAPTMFKWNNNFSWAYNGDITDSIKQNVKSAGGNVEGVLRFSIQWNENSDNNNDFDAHCIEPNKNHIWYSNKGRMHQSSGMLDVDIIEPQRQTNNQVAVENITWTDINRMQEGRYQFYVHNYSNRGGQSGFRAEIEYNGQIYAYDYPHSLRQDEKVIVAQIEFNRKDGIKFIKSLDSTVSSKEIWGIKTNNFTKVSVVMFSPNYWDKQKGIGNKHYFFFLNGCINDSTPRGFFNEFLNEKLTKHRKVFEALGSKLKVQDSNRQLSGLGFSSTTKNSILAKVEGSFSRVIKIIF